MMLTKNILPFALTIISLLIIDQLIKIHMQYLINNHTNVDISKYRKMRNILYILIMIIVTIGFIHYLIRARSEFGQNFSYFRFIFGTVKCRHLT